jgi:hypothetical protein
MALHLHLIGRQRSQGAGPANVTRMAGQPGRFRSGVWLLSTADAARQPDFVWLHEGTAQRAYFGGSVIAALEPAAPEHVTPGDGPETLDRRWTVQFDIAGRPWDSRSIPWRGTLMFNSYAMAEYDLA